MKTALTQVRREDADEVNQRPLELALIWRMFRYTKPHARKRNALFALVVVRSIQLPLLAWAIGAVINGPITHHDERGVLWGAAGYLALAAVTQFCFHFRQRLALELGESVIQDLRRDIFLHLMRMPMGFYNRTKLGRIISRYTSDAEAMRVGWQDVFFISAVQAGQMIVTALLMLWYDWVLFLVVLAMAPMLGALNYRFRRSLSRANREVQESWSRVTATLAESVTGIRVTQGFVRQEVNAGLFSDLIVDHSAYNVGVARASGVFLPMLELNSQTFTAALLVVGGYRVLNPGIHMDVGSLIQFFFLANMFFGSVQPIGLQYTQALTAMAGAERVFRLLDSKPDWEESLAARELPRLQGRVEFRNVEFSYVADRRALQRVGSTWGDGRRTYCRLPSARAEISGAIRNCADRESCSRRQLPRPRHQPRQVFGNPKSWRVERRAWDRRRRTHRWEHPSIDAPRQIGVRRPVLDSNPRSNR